MHGAPSVSYPVGRSALAGTVLLGVWTGGAAVCAAWLATGAAGWRAGAALAAIVAAGAWAAWSWWAHPVGVLAWDGAGWQFSQKGAVPDEEGAVRPALDLQRALLVRWQAPAGRSWLWLERGGEPVRWEALRRAVYSRAERDALSGAEPPSARP